MANYYGSARSNYFHVKDEAAFFEDMNLLSGINVVKSNFDSTSFCILGDDAGGYNWNVLEEDDNDYESVDLPDRVAKHLMNDEVAIFIEAGSEKLRYIFGVAIAINDKGERATITLGEIYTRAKELTNKPEKITFAEY